MGMGYDAAVAMLETIKKIPQFPKEAWNIVKALSLEKNVEMLSVYDFP
jgi:hypothetical protein